uniref:LysM peptidoglycan-binding domain-containing M23 family metallopeptidase n=1 Tax=Calothrix sp. PCC 6303 TaxID=1170562 RepID=UPI002AB0D534|nr:M23 family metallopeptidase [Calothrix sp. PCC 6303]
MAQTNSNDCPASALSRFLRHKVTSGETIESIAQRYNLARESITKMNPDGLRNGKIKVGSEILIPPYDGNIIEVSRGQSWREISKRYRVRADVLFELNGCKPPSGLAFIPINRTSNRRVQPASDSNDSSTISKFTSFPVPRKSVISLPYGWQNNPKTGEVFFHSGIDIQTAIGTPTQSVGDGTVVFAGTQGTYGNLVIINHGGGLQSRYGQLESIKVKVGEQLKAGDLIGVVGATGQPSSIQPHLHFEIRATSSLGWVAKDPKEFLENQGDVPPKNLPQIPKE